MSLFDFFKQTGKDDGFLSPLSATEKSKVVNLGIMVYQSIIMEKEGQAVDIIGVEKEELDLLRKLPVEDIRRLSQSATLVIKADEKTGTDMREAAEGYKKAFEANPYNDLALMSYGCAIANGGNLREGIKYVEKAVNVNPDNERAQRNLRGMRAHL
jgi:tetratricopeptide (TPR) repeat protein